MSGISKKQWVILACIAAVVAVVTGAYLLRGALHEPTRPDTTDSIEVLRKLAKANADSNRVKENLPNQSYEQDLKKFNLPADSAERESVWAKYYNALPKHTDGAVTPR